MTFDEILDQVRDLRQQRGRVSSQALKRRFELDDAYLDDLKVEFIEAEQVATDENGRILVWVGGETPSERTSQTTDSPGSELPSSAPLAQPDRCKCALVSTLAQSWSARWGVGIGMSNWH